MVCTFLYLVIFKNSLLKTIKMLLYRPKFSHYLCKMADLWQICFFVNYILCIIFSYLAMQGRTTQC